MRRVRFFALCVTIGLCLGQTVLGNPFKKDNKPIDKDYFQKIAMISAHMSMIAFKGNKTIHYPLQNINDPNEKIKTFACVFREKLGDFFTVDDDGFPKQIVKILSYDKNSQKTNSQPFLRDYKVLYLKEIYYNRHYMGRTGANVSGGWMFLLQDPDDAKHFYVVTALKGLQWGRPSEVLSIPSSATSQREGFNNIHKNFADSHVESRQQFREGFKEISAVLEKIDHDNRVVTSFKARNGKHISNDEIIDASNYLDQIKITYLFTGHSMGGGMATIAGYDFMNNYRGLLDGSDILQYVLQKRPQDSQAYIFTFSNLSTFNDEGVKQFNQDFGRRAFRWAFFGDPQAHPTLWHGFSPVGFTYSMDNKLFLNKTMRKLQENTLLSSDARAFYQKELQSTQRRIDGMHRLPYYGISLYLDQFYDEYREYWENASQDNPTQEEDVIKKQTLKELLDNHTVVAGVAQDKNYNDYYKVRAHQIIRLAKHGYTEVAHALYADTEYELATILTEGRKPRRGSGWGEVKDIKEVRTLLDGAKNIIKESEVANNIKREVQEELIGSEINIIASDDRAYNDYYKLKAHQMMALNKQGHTEAARFLYAKIKNELQEILKNGNPKRASLGRVSNTQEIDGLLEKANTEIKAKEKEIKNPVFEEVD